MSAPASEGVAPPAPQKERSWKNRVSVVCDDYCRDTSMHCLRYLNSQQDHPIPVGETSFNNNSSVLKKTVEKYCRETSLDGFKYVTGKRPKAERILWAVAILASMVGCALLIQQVWHRWKTSPIIVTFADKMESTSTIPFPTVTVCPMVKYIPALFDFEAALDQDLRPYPRLCEKVKLKMNTMKILCSSKRYKKRYRKYWMHNVDVEDDYINETSIEIMKEVAPTLNNTIKCAGLNNSCKGYLRTVLTEEGVCYTFNALPDQEIYNDIVLYNRNGSNDTQTLPIWTLDKGFVKNSSALKGKMPLQGLTIGYRRAIHLILSSNTTEADLLCRPLRGYRITLTSPAAAQQLLAVHYYLPESGVTQMALVPRVMDTDDDLRRYSVEDRHCVYPDERRLLYFATYTQGNCRLECLINAMLKICQCVQFYMPHKHLRLMVNEDACLCPPSCKSIHYSVEVTQSTMNVEEIARANLGDKIAKSLFRNTSMNDVVIYFKEGDFIAHRRTEVYGFGNFVAEVGGLLSLSTGFSILSLVELVYFFTIRLWHDTRALKVSADSEGKAQEEQRKVEEGRSENKEVNKHVIDIGIEDPALFTDVA